MFHEKIESATQMQSVLTAQSRPNCLIIDEIDGAPTVSRESEGERENGELERLGMPTIS